jgi:pimeloyl-ACP methyl ester carboxylesterase
MLRLYNTIRITIILPVFCLLSCCLATAEGVKENEQQMNINLSCKIMGKNNNRPIVLIHGFGATSHTWFKIVPALSSQYALYLIDLKGYGGSPRPSDGRYTLKEQVELLRKFINVNNLKDITLIGHSYGGGVALLTALSYQMENLKLIRNIILIDPMAYQQKLPWFIKALRLPIFSEVISCIVPDKLQVKMVMRSAFFDPEKISDESVEAYAESLGITGGHMSNIAVARQILPDDIDSITKSYSNLKIPCLIVWGDNDNIIPLEIGKKLNNAITNSKLCVVENCGHMPHEECPERVIKCIIHFLSENGD